jgi:hypothetical protein
MSTQLEVFTMLKFISALSGFAGLVLAVALTPEVRDGSVRFVVAATNADLGDTSTPVGLTITGLDRAFETRVELPRDTAQDAVHLTLPAGLYSVEGAFGSSSGDDEPVIPVLSSPEFVVVASGRVTTVYVHHVDVSELTTSGLAALGAELAP